MSPRIVAEAKALPVVRTAAEGSVVEEERPPGSSYRRGSPQRTARIVLAVALVLLGLWILQDFLNPIGWAIVLATATWPLYERFVGLLAERHHKALAPMLFTILIALVFVVPLGFAIVEIVRELHGFAGSVAEAQRTGLPVPDWVPQLPLIGDTLSDWWQSNLAEPGALSDLIGRADTGKLARLTQEVGIIVGRRLTLFAITILTLFFLFRHGVMLQRQSRVLIVRILGRPGEHLAELMVTAVRSTADGLVLVGLGEGALLGVAYGITGVPHPALLGAFTGLLAMIPFGAPVVFGAAALLLLLTGSTAMAIALIVFGFSVVFVADHFIRPVLIGGAAKLPFFWVLLGIFGGLATFGLLGLFLGPAVMAALISLWREWTEQRRRPA